MRALKSRCGLSSIVAMIFFIVVFISVATVLILAMGKQSQLNSAEVSSHLKLIDKANERIECTVYNGTDAVFINKGSKAVRICYVVIRSENSVNATRVDICLPPGVSYVVSFPPGAGEVGVVTSLGNYFFATG